MVRVSLWISVAVVAVLFGWGAWQRRWIADDGLIVLRTVRNLLAGNGPVFNQGERVEANTSTAWTYLMYVGKLGRRADAHGVRGAGAGAGAFRAGRGAADAGYRPAVRTQLAGRRAVMLPAGALVYIALPPARDFATSGLESGLALAYLGLLWWMMVRWSQPLRTRPDNQVFIGALAFVAGFSVLVRPELALMGGLALIMMLIAARTWRRRVLIVVAGGFLPVAYQIFRMGYYGLLVPGTALAKDAAGDKWSQGMIYLSNFISPYAMWLPVAAAGATGTAADGGPSPAVVPAPDAGAQLRPGGPGGAEPAGRGGIRPGERAAAGAVLDPPGRRFHARASVVGAAVLFAGPGRRHPRSDPRRARTYSRETGLLVGRCRQRALAGHRGLVAVGSKLAGDGRRRHPRHLLAASSTSAASTPRPPGTRTR